MRAIILGLALVSTPALADEQLKPFDFMGYVAGEIIPPEKLKKCGKSAPDQTCLVPLVQVSNVYVGYLLKTHDYRMTSLFIDAHPNSYTSLLDAFTAKYGQPCEVSEAVWKNAAGAELENPSLHWCFSTGKLTFSKYGAYINKMGILYKDVNQPPESPPTINF